MADIQGQDSATRRAEDVRKKGHEAAAAARGGVEKATDKVQAAEEYANRAEELLRTAEEKLDSFIDTAERLLQRGSRYTEKAKGFLHEHPEYRERARSVISKAQGYKNRIRSRGEDSAATAESMRERGHEALDEGRRRAGEAVQHGKEKLSSIGPALRGGVSKGGRFVRENPTDALLLGAAAGLIAGTVIRQMRGSRPADTAQGETEPYLGNLPYMGVTPESGEEGPYGGI